MPETTVSILALIAAACLGGLCGVLGASRTRQKPSDDLRERLELLESRETAREIEFRETKDQVYRHLKRVQALKQHSGDSEADRQAALNASIRARRASRMVPLTPNDNGDGA